MVYKDNMTVCVWAKNEREKTIIYSYYSLSLVYIFNPEEQYEAFTSLQT